MGTGGAGAPSPWPQELTEGDQEQPQRRGRWEPRAPDAGSGLGPWDLMREAVSGPARTLRLAFISLCAHMHGTFREPWREPPVCIPGLVTTGTPGEVLTPTGSPHIQASSAALQPGPLSPGPSPIPSSAPSSCLFLHLLGLPSADPSLSTLTLWWPRLSSPWGGSSCGGK